MGLIAVSVNTQRAPIRGGARRPTSPAFTNTRLKSRSTRPSHEPLRTYKAWHPLEDFNYQNVGIKLAQNAKCSTATDRLVALQCYSNYYYNSGIEQGGAAGSCMKRIDINWTAITAEFVEREGGPAGMHVRALGYGGTSMVMDNLPSQVCRTIPSTAVSASRVGQATPTCRVSGNERKLAFTKSPVEGGTPATYESFSVNLDQGLACLR